MSSMSVKLEVFLFCVSCFEYGHFRGWMLHFIFKRGIPDKGLLTIKCFS